MLEEIITECRDGKVKKSQAYARVVRLIDEDVTLNPDKRVEKIDTCITKIDDALSQRSRIRRREEDNEDDRPVKRVCLREQDMPWYGKMEDVEVNPLCLETARLLEIYNRDIRGAMFAVKTAPNAPTGFPRSQWKRILEGDPVDLNVVLSSFQLPLGSRGKRTVQTFVDWDRAWNSTAEAMAFAFPHRRRELEEYGKWIRDFFIAMHESFHYKIIAYDIAIRETVESGCQILLNDRNSHELAIFYSTILLNPRS